MREKERFTEWLQMRGQVGGCLIAEREKEKLN